MLVLVLLPVNNVNLVHMEHPLGLRAVLLVLKEDMVMVKDKDSVPVVSNVQ
jgi:hypothetical protein